MIRWGIQNGHQRFRCKECGVMFTSRRPDISSANRFVWFRKWVLGKQSPVIVAVTDRETRDYVSKLNAKVMGADTDPFYGAPVVLIVLADRNIPTYQYDGSLVMGNLLNAAHAVGLGSCWIHRAKEVFDSEEGKALLKKWGIEGDYEGIGNCIIGYSAQEAPQPKPRKAGYVYYIE